MAKNAFVPVALLFVRKIPVITAQDQSKKKNAKGDEKTIRKRLKRAKIYNKALFFNIFFKDKIYAILDVEYEIKRAERQKSSNFRFWPGRTRHFFVFEKTIPSKDHRDSRQNE
jgi:hypothetical protein